MEIKDKIVKLLKSTERKGMDSMIEWMEKEGFFDSPCSTRFHQANPGGLAAHSLRVFENLESMPNLELSNSKPGQKALPVKYENMVIAGLLHDVCKVGAYIGTEAPYKWNKQQPRGHATLSIERTMKFIELDPIEELMIRYHMGPYGCFEFYEEDSWEYKANAEYPLIGDHSKDKKLSKEESQKARYGQSLRNVWYHNPIVKVMYICDELSTMEKEKEE